MKLKAYAKFFITALLSLCFLRTSAQDNTVLTETINRAHRSGVEFAPVSLFKATEGQKHANILSEETLLDADITAIASLYKTKPQAVSLPLRTEKGESFLLEMVQNDPFSQDANIGYLNAGGSHKMSYDHGVHYRGAVVGSGRSLATLSVFANGEVMIMYANEDGNFIVGKLDDGSGKYVLYNDRNFLERPYAPCGVNQKDYQVSKEPVNTGKVGVNLVCRKVRLYWEADYQLYLSRGDTTKTINYLTGLFGQVQAMYYNENIVVELKSVYVWTSPDPYQDASSDVGLSSFTAAWNAKNDAFDGDLAHLITLDGKSNGGRGFLDILCSRKFCYAYSEVHGSYSKIPTYSWDVEVVTHETGHNLGSHHTHWCGWNQGPGNSCGAIDSCTKIEGSGSCADCPHLYNNNNTSWKGSVMSYCHLISTRGIDLANGFGPLPGDYIRQQVDGATCLYFIDTCFPVGVHTASTENSNQVKLYPNPATESVAVQYYSTCAGEGEIKVLDILGHLVIHQRVDYTAGENQMLLDLAALEKGVYILSFTGNKRPPVNEKLILQ